MKQKMKQHTKAKSCDLKVSPKNTFIPSMETKNNERKKKTR